MVGLEDSPPHPLSLHDPSPRSHLSDHLQRGVPPKEEAMMAIALNRIYTPILRQQVSEIVDFFLPMEALSYKAAIISIDKAYPGQARRGGLSLLECFAPIYLYQICGRRG